MLAAPAAGAAALLPSEAPPTKALGASANSPVEEMPQLGERQAAAVFSDLSAKINYILRTDEVAQAAVITVRQH